MRSLTSGWCDTAVMAFHEAFWVVTGTAAPVLGLAAVVSFNEMNSLSDQLRVQLMNERAGLIVKRAQVHNPEYDSLVDGYLMSLSIRTGLTGVRFFVQFLNMTAQGVLLALSLWAIVTQRNVASPVLAGVIAVYGFLHLAGAGVQRTTASVARNAFLAREAELLKTATEADGDRAAQAAD